ncbi:MAG: PIN domain-containing protein [Bacteroides sp.]|nr:PIN domain-containing protein [Bacteroides sp.]
MIKRFMLDTNAVIEMLHGNRKMIGCIERAGRKNCCISEITIAELYYGAVKGGNPKNFQDIETVQRIFEIAPLYPTYLEYAKIRHNLVTKGLAIDTFDMLIGASAIQCNCVLITHNRKHFERIPNLVIEDWQL